MTPTRRLETTNAFGLPELPWGIGRDPCASDCPAKSSVRVAVSEKLRLPERSGCLPFEWDGFPSCTRALKALLTTELFFLGRCGLLEGSTFRTVPTTSLTPAMASRRIFRLPIATCCTSSKNGVRRAKGVHVLGSVMGMHNLQHRLLRGCRCEKYRSKS